MDASQDSQKQKEEAKDAEEEKAHQAADPKINPISNEEPGAGGVINLGKGNEVLPNPYSDPPTPIPPEVHKEHLPDTEATGTMPATFNLSPNGIPQKTITGYFPRAEKTTSNPAPPSLSQ